MPLLARSAVLVPIQGADPADRGKRGQTTLSGHHREYVFIYRDGPVYQTSTRAFKAAAKRAGLPADFRWHDLRHLWASWLAQDGTLILALQELGGWQSESMVRRYAHFSVEHLRPYVNRPVEGEGNAQGAGNAQAAGPSPSAEESDPPVDRPSRWGVPKKCTARNSTWLKVV